ncbi:hypothetical protein F2Q69_00024297 [Brassica cretica]|uniref:Plant bHLH transcription factor ACT-like domain-containing protein n=1 Tax=Brassica cretica TaxID=69181 RepID=A0A8S9QLN0_BRACR|nr:hypothetical protein F2Q69_00024297 [Brassica cretica]
MFCGRRPGLLLATMKALDNLGLDVQQDVISCFNGFALDVFRAEVEVRLREGSAVNIHMFCGRRPGLLLATMKALDNLGLDVQQAVISCFNGFALDVFRAEV